MHHNVYCVNIMETQFLDHILFYLLVNLVRPTNFPQSYTLLRTECSCHQIPTSPLSNTASLLCFRLLLPNISLSYPVALPENSAR